MSGVHGWLRFSSLTGLAACLYVLGGRWSLTRLVGNVPPFDVFLHLRFWVIFLFVILLLLRAMRRMDFAEHGRGLCRSAQVLVFASASFLVYMVATGLWTSNTAVGIYKQLDGIFMLVATTACYHCLVLSDGEEARRAFWRFTVLLTSLLAALAVATVVIRGPQRMAVLGGGPIVFGRLMGLLCLGSLYFLQLHGRRLWLVPAGLAAVLSMASGSRGPFGSLLVALLVFAMLGRRTLRVLAGFFITGAGLLFLVFQYSAVGKTTLEYFTRRLTDPVTGGFYFSQRGKLFESALDIGMADPIVGTGLGDFAYGGVHFYPHNLLLEIFSESGLVGVALFFLATLVAFHHIGCHRQRVDAATAAGLALFFVASQFSGDLYDSRSIFVFMLLCFVRKREEPDWGPRRVAVACPLESGSI
jgi:O-antigen ligase